MAQHYSDPSRETDPYALPDVETFYIGLRAAEEDCPQCADPESDGPAADPGSDHAEHVGWYYWFCFPGCMPDSDAFGPYPSEQAALDAARDA
jgi:hypothetical protein